MKLIYCRSCNSVFNLQAEMKSCVCGKSRGRYTVDPNAEYYGEEAVPFAIDNYSFFARIKKTAEDIYDSFHGKGRIQCWILEEGQPNFESIKKVDALPEPEIVPEPGEESEQKHSRRTLGRCGR